MIKIITMLVIYYIITICATAAIAHKNNKNKRVYKIKCALKDGHIDKIYCPAHWLDQYKTLYTNSYGDNIKYIITKPIKIWMCPNPYKEIFNDHWDNIDKIFSDMLDRFAKEK